MSNLPRAVLNKIPGLPLAKQENHKKDLKKLTTIELQEIREREENLLANQAKLNRLPDKGKRIKDFYVKVLEEQQRRSNIDDAAAMFSTLNIAERGKAALNELEWNGHDVAAATCDASADVLDSDDETEMDPLRVIAQRQMHERRVKVVPPEPQLITAEDLSEIKSFYADSTASSDSRSATPSELDQHVRYVVEKTEMQAVPPLREKFMPYKTTLTNVHDPAKERDRKRNAHWEITAATPPPIQHQSAQLLTLMDSVEIQETYLAKMKQLYEKQAADRLTARLERLNSSTLSASLPEELKTKASFITYRNIEGHRNLDDADEVYDPMDTDAPGGGVSYTVFQ